MDERRGTIFAGRYRLERRLGSGGMADVWLAEDQELGRRVAIKILHERYANDVQFVERFRREATHAAGLSHPNVVAIHDRGEAEGSYFIVMEYVEGRTLKELIVTRGMCPIPVAISYTRQVLAALRYAHRNGIVHRDIKPHNVLVDNEGRVKVADFGIARAGTSQMTEAGSIIGTAQYLSPEQARGAPGGRVLRPLLDRDRALRAAHREGAVHGRDARRDRDEAPIADPRGAVGPPSGDPTRPRPRRASALWRRSRPIGIAPRRRWTATSSSSAAARPSSRRPRRRRRWSSAARPPPPPPSPQPVRPAGVGGDERYRSYEGAVRRGRAWWPWLLALGAALALGIGGWLFYDNVRDQIDANEPVAVNDYNGILEQKAVAAIVNDGFDPNVRRLPNSDVQKGYVYDQEPEAGSRQAKGSIVTILVSSGKRNISVPSLVGKSRDTAVKELTSLGLDADVHEIPSDKTSDTVTAQDPRPGTIVVEGASVRVNVSSGPKPVAVPAVIGQTYETAAAQLQSAGFTVGRADVESNRPAGEVVDQDPPGNSTASRGSSVTLSVSQGPKTTDRPRRLAAERRRRARNPPRGGLQVERDAAGDGRRGARRARDQPGPGGERAGRPEVGREADRGGLRAAAGRHVSADEHRPTPTPTTTPPATTQPPPP